ncbi:MAG: hypothetical protein FWF94_05315 [Oscillospiraceae bacterium]|nr:hypothetical protein [Oscillospiraceae bacterium]
MRSSSHKLRDLTVFALLAATILALQIVLYGIPGVQFNGLLISAITVAYGKRALIPIYVYVLLYCFFYGFVIWNLPYFYIWLPLWGGFMLVSRIKLSKKFKVPLFMLLSGLFGLSFGALYAPVQAVFFSLNLKQTLAWVIAGFPTDVIHAVNNFFTGILIVPLSELLIKLDSLNNRSSL